MALGAKEQSVDNSLLLFTIVVVFELGYSRILRVNPP